MHETTVAVGAGAIMAVSMSVVPGSVIMTMVIMLMVSMPMVMMPMVMMPMVMMPVPVAMRAAAKHERARDIDAKPECCDRNRLGILDRHRRQEAQHRLVTDAERDDAPGPALVAHMAGAEEDMAVSEGGSLVARAHAGLITLRRMCISCGLAPAASARRSSSGIAADGACPGRIET